MFTRHRINEKAGGMIAAKNTMKPKTAMEAVKWQQL
jgi:hypothetical protein